MARYLLQLDLDALGRQLSDSLGIALSLTDVREILRAAGMVESPRGWIAGDLRPLGVLYLARGGLFG